jgi:hypothetical protein
MNSEYIISWQNKILRNLAEADLSMLKGMKEAYPLPKNPSWTP